jgi:hypothetical protein
MGKTRIFPSEDAGLAPAPQQRAPARTARNHENPDTKSPSLLPRPIPRPRSGPRESVACAFRARFSVTRLPVRRSPTSCTIPRCSMPLSSLTRGLGINGTANPVKPYLSVISRSSPCYVTQTYVHVTGPKVSVVSRPSCCEEMQAR